MTELIKDATKALYHFLTNRIIWLIVVTIMLFSFLFTELFYLQIIISDTFTIPPPNTTTVTQTIPALRGNIYDRFGRPLTINTPVFTVIMDPSVPVSNEALLELTRIFERNNEDFTNEFPMTTTWPYQFTFGGPTPEIRQRREFRWKDDMTIPEPETATAADSFVHLLEQFNIDPKLSREDARRILNLRTMIYERRFRPQLFVIAANVSVTTVTAIEEQRAFFSNVSIEMRALREYPQGIYFSHILGYIGTINAEELEANPDYAHDDVIGKVGLERSQEHWLRGRQGTQVVEVNPSTGRRVDTLPEVTPPVSGYNIFLTIDSVMQRKTYFFFETAFRLGSNPRQRIDTLNRYMEFFGLNQRTGVEIGELADTFNRQVTPDIMASPSLKEFLHLRRDEFTPRNQWDWFDGDTIRAAIGQSYNNYSSAMMARYIAQIANNGVRFPLHMVSAVKSYCGVVVKQAAPQPDNIDMIVSDSSWNVIQRGMLHTTQGRGGTAAGHFRGFPIQVAGKTGTAEQTGSRLSHSSFGGYAPFDDPQIAVYVTIPFGDTRVMPAAATQIARDVIYAFLVPEIAKEYSMPVNAIVR